MYLNIIHLLFVMLDVPMADKMRQEGKIYVVVGVLLLILAGLLLYLFYLDGRVKKIESEIKSKTELKP